MARASRNPVREDRPPGGRRAHPPTALEVRGLHKRYGTRSATVHALHGVDLTIERGSFTSVMGPSGSGKSTLLHMIGLLDAPDKGRIRLFGREAGRLPSDARALLRRRVVGFVFQSFHLLPNLTVMENVVLPLRIAGVRRRQRVQRGQALLGQVGLEARARHKPHELSGGERQRVAIARALATDPPLILADEPTGNLDSQNGHAIMRLLQSLQEEGRTVLQVTHDAEMARYGDRIVQMRDGKIAASKPRPDGAPLPSVPSPKTAPAGPALRRTGR